MTTYYVKSGTGGDDTGSSLANAAESLAGLMAAQVITAGDIVLVDKAHSFNAGAAITWEFPETAGTAGMVAVLCVDTGASDVLDVGAVETTGGNFAFNIGSKTSAASLLYVHGMAITAGGGASSSSADIIVASALNGAYTFESCTFWTNSTNVGAIFQCGGSSSTGQKLYTFNNCVFRFGATTQSLQPVGGKFFFRNCSISASGSSPTLLFSQSGGCIIECSGCDFHLATTIVSIAATGDQYFRMFNCYTGTNLVTGTHPGYGGNTYEFIGCGGVDGGGIPDNFQYAKYDGFGIVSRDLVAYLTTDPSQATRSDGTATSYSYSMLPAATVTHYAPLYTPWIAVEVTSTGSRTFTLKCADIEGAVLKDTDVWVEVTLMGGGGNVAATPQALTYNGGQNAGSTYSRDPKVAGSNLTDTNAAWTGVTETDTYDLSVTVSNLDYQGYVYCRVGLGKYLAGNAFNVDGKIRVS